jgi:hypothetical protein
LLIGCYCRDDETFTLRAVNGTSGNTSIGCSRESAARAAILSGRRKCFRKRTSSKPCSLYRTGGLASVLSRHTRSNVVSMSYIADISKTEQTCIEWRLRACHEQAFIPDLFRVDGPPGPFLCGNRVTRVDRLRDWDFRVFDESPDITLGSSGAQVILPQSGKWTTSDSSAYSQGAWFFGSSERALLVFTCRCRKRRSSIPDKLEAVVCPPCSVRRGSAWVPGFSILGRDWSLRCRELAVMPHVSTRSSRAET